MVAAQGFLDLTSQVEAVAESSPCRRALGVYSQALLVELNGAAQVSKGEL